MLKFQKEKYPTNHQTLELSALKKVNIQKIQEIPEPLSQIIGYSLKIRALVKKEKERINGTQTRQHTVTRSTRTC